MVSFLSFSEIITKPIVIDATINAKLPKAIIFLFALEENTDPFKGGNEFREEKIFLRAKTPAFKPEKILLFMVFYGRLTVPETDHPVIVTIQLTYPYGAPGYPTQEEPTPSPLVYTPL